MKRYVNVLCATDFSADSDRAVARAAALAREGEGALTLLHVVAHFPVDRSNELIAPENVDPLAFRVEKARERLAEQAQRLGCPEADREVVATTGDAGHEIVRYAEARGCDLIVVGSRVVGGASEPLGSVAGSVQRHVQGEVELVHVA